MNYTTYEQALKLKQLGFNEECIKCYFPKLDTEGFDLVFTNNAIHNDYLTIRENIMNGIFTIAIFAPFISQSINWFRKQEIYGYIHSSVASNYPIQCTFTVYDKNFQSYCSPLVYNNYEDCEKALLEYLLNNIQDVKN